MKHVLIITAVVVLYGIGNGLMVVGTPQLALHLGVSSRELGLLGIGSPLGYALSCLLLGRISHKVSSKAMLLCGALSGVLAIVAMALSQSAWTCAVSQLLYGLTAGAFWPFASAWMLEFQSQSLSKTTIFRFYNAAWTGGEACGMFIGGSLCDRGWIIESLFVAAVFTVFSFVLAFAGRSSSLPLDLSLQDPGQQDPFTTLPSIRPLRLGLPLLAAAVIANLAVLATRSVVTVNYAELNQFQNFGASRMGIIVGSILLSQLAAFLLGYFYEPYLGLRRIYILLAISLMGINLAFAYGTHIWILTAAGIVLGLSAAVAFQAGIIAATDTFSRPRSGTTFHEAVIGIGGLSPLFAGLVVEYSKSNGVEALQALRAPFVLLAIVIGGGLLLQMGLVSLRSEKRVLLPKIRL